MEPIAVETVKTVPCMFSKSALLGSLAHQAEIAWRIGDKQHAVRCAGFWLELGQQVHSIALTLLLFYRARKYSRVSHASLVVSRHASCRCGFVRQR
jgi:hypothetical protein